MEEYDRALEDLNDKRVIWGLADKEYEAIAYHEMKAAEERVMAIIRKMKGGAKGESSRI